MLLRTRRLVSRILLSALAFPALALTVAGGALLLERRGAVTLRRVPRPIIKTWAEPGEIKKWLDRTAAIAIVNTDTVPGSFLLGFVDAEPRDWEHRWEHRPMGFILDDRRPRQGDEVRIWVPRRSIVLKALPRPRCVAWLFDTQGSIGYFEWDHAERAFRRGTRVTLEWQPYQEWEADAVPTCFRIRGDGFRILERPGVAAQKDRASSRYYHWDGKPVEADIDATDSPRLSVVEATACSDRSSIGESHGWAYDSDMTVIDERTPSPTR